MDKISLILNSRKEALSLYQHDDPHQEEVEQASGNPSNPPGVSTATRYESIIKPRDGSTTNNGSDETPSRTTPCNTQASADRKQTASNDQTSTLQGSSTQPSKESTERSEQQSGKNEDQDKNQHQGNAQQPNNGGNDESNGDKDHQDKQPNDDQQKDDQQDDEQEDKSDEEDEEEVSEDDEDQEPLKLQAMAICYPTPRERRFTPRPHYKTSFGRPIPEMLKPSKSKHLSMERPSTSSGFVSVDRKLSEKAETRLKKAYEKKCKQQQGERINSIEDLPVSSEPYEINLLDRKFYYNDDGTENLYDGPKEIAAKLGLEYKGSPIITIYPSSTAMKQPSGSSSHLPRSPPKVETGRAMPENHKPKNSHTPTRITLAAYKEERRRKVLERNQS